MSGSSSVRLTEAAKTEGSVAEHSVTESSITELLVSEHSGAEGSVELTGHSSLQRIQGPAPSTADGEE